MRPALILFVALLLPATAAGPLHWAGASRGLLVELGSDALLIHETFEHAGTQAAALRTMLDVEYGDRNGLVEASEVERYARGREAEAQTSPSCLKADRYARLNETTAHVLVGSRTRLEGAEGPVQESSAILETVRTELRFPTNGTPVRFEVWIATLPQLSGACRGGTAGSHVTLGPNLEAELDRGPPRLRVQALPTVRIDPEALEPASLKALWRSEGVESRTWPEYNALHAAQLNGTLWGAHPAAGTPSLPLGEEPADARTAWVAWGLLLALPIVAWRVEWLRWSALRPVALLFSRLQRGEALLHPRRQEILQALEGEPGACLADLHRDTGIPQGSLVHHLRILESKGFVRAVRDKHRTRFFPRGHGSSQPYLTGYQQRLVELVRTRPGLTQVELATDVGTPRDQVGYHLRRLESLGVVASQTDGRYRRYFPAPPA